MLRRALFVLIALHCTLAFAADVPVKIVVLYSSGVGYFEHFGTVKDNQQTELRFKTDQINDILKSLVLQDTGGGTISTVSYPSQDPLSKTLKSFQVDIAGNPTLGDLLNQLRGARVKLSVQAETIEGTILGVEKKQVPGQEVVVERSFLNLITNSGIRSIQIDDVREITLLDAQLQEELNKALAALAKARDQDKKRVVINFNGQGERQVRIGYVIETPIWKTSYRLILGNGDEKAKLQGWAIVENQTENDWNDVQLGLVSGRPISFIENLYQSLYVPRPVMQTKLYESLRPQEYEEGIAAQGELRGQQRDDRARDIRQKAIAEQQMAAPAGSSPMVAGKFIESIDPIRAGQSIQAMASAAELGELFQFTIPNVTLARQQSAMIPIVTDEVEAERVSIYNPSVLANYPLNGATLKNTTGKHLLQGPITVLDANAYAGDARIEDIPPGQERLISYGVDLQMRVKVDNQRSENTILSGKIVKGVLHISRRHTVTQDYVAQNKSDKDKTLIIEHTQQGGGWKLVDTQEPIETTNVLYRFKKTVPAGKTERLTVKEEQVAGEAVAIMPADLGQLQFYATTGEIPQKVREALAKAVAMKQTLVDIQRDIEQRQQRIGEITQEQNRIRENMRTIDRNTELYTRLLKKLNDQETQFETLQGEIDDLQTRRQQQQKELEQYLSNTTIDP